MLVQGWNWATDGDYMAPINNTVILDFMDDKQIHTFISNNVPKDPGANNVCYLLTMVYTTVWDLWSEKFTDFKKSVFLNQALNLCCCIRSEM